MILGKFFGIEEHNKNKVYIVVKCEDSEEAIKTANKLFKIKSDKLTVRKVYMVNEDSDEFSFDKYEDAFMAWAVFRK